MRFRKFVWGGVAVALAVLLFVAGGASAHAAASSGVSGKSLPATLYFIFEVVTKGTFHKAPAVLYFHGTGAFTRTAVTGHGIFAVENPMTGAFLSQGTWQATTLVSFVSYGFFTAFDLGGNLTLLATLHFLDGQVQGGFVMQITCIQGPHSPATALEGATLVKHGFWFLSPFVPPLGLTAFSTVSTTSAVAGQGTEMVAAAAFRSSAGACNLGCC